MNYFQTFWKRYQYHVSFIDYRTSGVTFESNEAVESPQQLPISPQDQQRVFRINREDCWYETGVWRTVFERRRD